MIFMNGFSLLHPTVRLLLWGACVTVGQHLEFARLVVVLGSLALLVVFLAGQHGWRLLKRARILLLTIGLLFACGTPGESLMPALGVMSPTSEGLMLALEHGGRLLLVLALLALLLQFTTQVDLVTGIYGVLRPFSLLKLPRERIALRLLLVLQYAEAQKSMGRLISWRQWLDWLESEEVASPSSVPLYLRVSAPRPMDYLALLVGLGVLTMLIWM